MAAGVPAAAGAAVDPGRLRAHAGRQQAGGATTHEENDTATIRVTEEAAHSGKRSLKFTDGPGQKYAFNPHLNWTPKYTRGTAECSFALRPGGAALAHEWRTSGSAYKTGPGVYVAADGAVRFRGDPSAAPARSSSRPASGRSSTSPAPSAAAPARTT